ncbi:MAG: T9SS C-terminal target domain-containing protein [Candidatus Neomarinimicrobiota bacterium]|nr:MAG: T9SS C-terminal target domain-containing protein [Candidatus Neomarinimicrobiota bacterium]
MHRSKLQYFITAVSLVSLLAAGQPETTKYQNRRFVPLRELRVTPHVVSTGQFAPPTTVNPLRDTQVTYEETFENGLGDWTTHDGTLPTGMWHLDDFNTPDGTGLSWWMGDTTINGYVNSSYLVLDTDPILVPAGGALTFDLNYSVESPGGEPQGYDGWDGCNIRLSTDNGATWTVISGTPAYNATSLYSFGFEHGEGTGVPGWGGSSNGWVSASFDLSSYERQSVRIRFAFASDPGYSTQDDPSLFGMIVDNILLGTFFNDGVDTMMTSSSMVPVAGDIWHLGEPGDAPSPTHAMICSNDSNTYVPNMLDFLISPTITLPDEGEIKADFLLKGDFSDNDAFPNVDWWGWEISIDGGTTWYAMSNPYNDPAGSNYVYTDAPTEWASVTDSYNGLDGRLDDYAGMDVKFRIYFESDEDSPIGSGIMIDNFTISQTTYLAAPTNLTATANADNQVELTWDDLNQPSETLFYYGDINNISYPYFVPGSGDLWISADTGSGWAMQYNAPLNTQLTTIYYGLSSGNVDYTGQLVPIRIKVWDNSQNLIWASPNFTPSAMDTILSYDVSGEGISVIGDFYVGWTANDTTQPFVLVDFDNPYGAAYGYHGSGALISLAGTSWDGNYAIFADGVQSSGETVTYNVYHSLTSGQDYTQIGSTPTASFTDTDPMIGADNYYVVTAVYASGESPYSNEASVYVMNTDWVEYAYDDGTSEAGINMGAGNYTAVKFTTGTGGTLTRINWYQIGSGGALYLKVFEDNGGVPGAELYSRLTAGGNDGWNFFDLPVDVSVPGDFWVGINELSTTLPIGLDTGSDSGHSYYSIDGGTTWDLLSNLGYTGNVMIRTYVVPSLGTEEESVVPDHFALAPAYPNPFNPSTQFSFAVPRDGMVTIQVADLTGRIVAEILNDSFTAGTYTLTWNARNLPSGVYFLLAQFGDQIRTQKIILMK